MQPHVGWLRGDSLQEAVKGNPKLKVGGGRTPWLVSQVARAASHQLECYRLSNPSLDSYKYPTTSGNQSDTHYM
jgi:hypothetical protein